MLKATLAILSLLTTLHPTVASADETSPHHDWSGGYIGANVGFIIGESRNEWNSPDAGFPLWQPDGDISFDSFTGGAYAGYLEQFGRLVLGAEADINRFALEGDDSGAATLVNGITMTTAASLRARMGIAHKNTLVYATAGLSLGDYTKTDETMGWSKDDRLAGWTIGAGVEQAISDRWSIRFDLRYTDYGKVASRLSDGGMAYYNHRAVDLSTQQARIGVSYRF